MTVRKVIGAEYDVSQLRKLSDVLNTLGAQKIEAWSGLAGSQDVRFEKYEIGASILTVEVETYMGIAIEGEEGTVNAISSRLGHPDVTPGG